MQKLYEIKLTNISSFCLRQCSKWKKKISKPCQQSKIKLKPQVKSPFIYST